MITLKTENLEKISSSHGIQEKEMKEKSKLLGKFIEKVKAIVITPL